MTARLSKRRLEELWAEATGLPAHPHANPPLTAAIIVEAMEGGGVDDVTVPGGAVEVNKAGDALLILAQDIEAFARVVLSTKG